PHARAIPRHVEFFEHRAERALQQREKREGHECAREERQQCRNRAWAFWPEKKSRRIGIVTRKKSRSPHPGLIHQFDALSGAEVVIPSSRLQIVVEVKSKHETRKAVIRELLVRGIQFLPVPVFLIDVRAEFFAGGALLALRIWRRAQAVRLR